MVRTDDPEVVWDKPNEVDNKWIQFIDDNVLASKLIYSSSPYMAVSLMQSLLRLDRSPYQGLSARDCLI